MPKPPYIWAPLTSLDEIQLLVLHSGGFSSDLVIDVLIVPAVKWRNGDSYEALSYCCGTPEFDYLVTCGECEIPVTKNLYIALRFLRRSEGDRLIWVDAICIDQSNIKERNQQILLMHDIYRSSTKVIAWVGEESDDSKILMMLGNHQVEFIDEPERNTSSTLSMEMILQEVALAKALEIQCGLRTVAWSDIEALLKVLRTRLYSQFSDLKAVVMLFNALDMAHLRIQAQDGKLLDIQSAHKRSRNFKATDPRDLVYGLRGIMHENCRSLISPDYHKHHDEVFRDTALCLLHHSNSLEWLSYARPIYDMGEQITFDQTPERPHSQWQESNPHMQRSTLPTWVVDWTFAEEPEDALELYLRHPIQLDTPENMYRAAADTKARFLPQDDPNTLALEGRVIGSIHSCARLFQNNALKQADINFPERPAQHSFLIAYNHCVLIAIKHINSDTYSPTGESLEVAIWRTLVANRWSVRSGERHWNAADDEMKSLFHEWIKLMTVEKEDVIPPVILWRSMSAGVLGRCLCAIGDNYIGLCHPAVKEGDVVVALYGANVPYVLRKVNCDLDHTASSTTQNATNTPSVDEFWTLVGEAYVHGCMDGEIFKCKSNFIDQPFKVA